MRITYKLRVIFKYPYQRIRYGYDERIKWQFDSYFERAIKPLKEFCQEQLSNTESMRLNTRRKRVFTKTLQLIDEYETADLSDYYKNNNPMERLFAYVGKHISIYWD